ncbi:hypothetical protein BT67DRAFT_237383 [Trichocladium antarcticum]|uniref:Uncharacterized protein n=1 Tax=Trichocladium antarcticum TaxID=1450529 RepID=A0AAN6UNI5_9PEZI|nr:hypothetical protein BT67DRAFT_237383 [Trichocladium antarcticum]
MHPAIRWWARGAGNCVLLYYICCGRGSKSGCWLDCAGWLVAWMGAGSGCAIRPTVLRSVLARPGPSPLGSAHARFAVSRV